MNSFLPSHIQFTVSCLPSHVHSFNFGMDEDPEDAEEAARPVVFLDVDGVLSLDEESFAEIPMRALKALCDTRAADVVVSSDWRWHVESMKRLEAALAEIGVAVICSHAEERAACTYPDSELRWSLPIY